MEERKGKLRKSDIEQGEGDRRREGEMEGGLLTCCWVTEEIQGGRGRLRKVKEDCSK